MLTEHQRQQLSRPLREVRFVVLPGAQNSTAAPVARFVTSGGGSFRLARLPAGTYCVVEDGRQLTAEPDAGAMLDCLAAQRLKCTELWRPEGPGFSPAIDIYGHCEWNQPCFARGVGAPP